MRFEGGTFAEAYNQALAYLKEAPEYSPRGMRTKELLGCQIYFDDARARLALAPGRKYNLAFALAETLWMYAGREDLEFVERYNKRYRDFSDDGVRLYGAYGPRVLRHHVRWFQKIRGDPDTRQAVVTVYSNEDLYAATKDLPCTIAWQLFQRDGRLHMICTMRSNDIFWGVPYDVFVNTMLLEHWAYQLGLKPGSYTHQSASLHVYERHYQWLDMEFASVAMPDQQGTLFMRSLGVAEEMSRELNVVVDPANSLVDDCSVVFCRYHLHKRRELAAATTCSLPRDWAAGLVRDFES